MWTLDHDISRTESRMVKILSPIDSTPKITQDKVQKTAFRRKLKKSIFDLWFKSRYLDNGKS